MTNKYKLKNHLFLFDIDGTILDSTGAGKKAFIFAFEKVLNIKIDENINFLGGIDNGIFKNLYYKYNLSKESLFDKWEKFKKIYIKNLSSFSLENNWKIFPNTEYAIKLLSKESNIALVTGNIEKGAKIKLQKFNLDKYFMCGGFGDNATNRSDVVKNTIGLCENIYHKKFKKNNIFLFGDTKKDIKSAIENNINPVLIDQNKKYKDNAKEWAAKYHGNFINIEAFLKIISNSKTWEELIHF